MIRRLQNKIAESRIALPLTAVYGLMVCVVFALVHADGAPLQSLQFWVQVVLLGVSTVLMAELNNSNALIRIYSRMVSCSFLVLMLTSPFLFTSVQGGIVTLAFVVFYLFFLRSYQDSHAVGAVYTAFLALGMASVCFVQMLYYVPLLWLLMWTRLQAFSARTFFASLLGLLTPYWFLSVRYLYLLDYQTPLDHFLQLARFEPLQLPPFLLSGELLVLVFVLLLTVTGIVHFLRQRSHDKLRTQMVCELFISVTVFTVIFLLLQPQHFPFLLRLLIVNTAIFIGHFIALTRTKVTNIAFIVIVAVALALTVFNLWMPSFSF